MRVRTGDLPDSEDWAAEHSALTLGSRVLLFIQTSIHMVETRPGPNRWHFSLSRSLQRDHLEAVTSNIVGGSSFSLSQGRVSLHIVHIPF